jgi:hypothetical protein
LEVGLCERKAPSFVARRRGPEALATENLRAGENDNQKIEKR